MTNQGHQLLGLQGKIFRKLLRKLWSLGWRCVFGVHPHPPPPNQNYPPIDFEFLCSYHHKISPRTMIHRLLKIYCLFKKFQKGISNRFYFLVRFISTSLQSSCHCDCQKKKDRSKFSTILFQQFTLIRHWRICGVAWAAAQVLYGPKLSQFHALFQKILQNRMLAPPEGWHPVLRICLDWFLYVDCTQNFVTGTWLPSVNFRICDSLLAVQSKL